VSVWRELGPGSCIPNRDKESPLGIHSMQKLWGKEISFNNYLDIDACFQMLSDLDGYGHACVIFKHSNPNGIAVDTASQLEACKARV